MISIFIMYSGDRAKALSYTIGCLKQMSLYENCQKTLVTDGQTPVSVEDWGVIAVPRRNDKFCWASMWNAGISNAYHPGILYLDSDRILPANFLTLVQEKLEDDTFVFTSNHFQMLRELSLESCQRFLRRCDDPDVYLDPEFVGSVIYEPLAGQPRHGPGKNVMSGCVAFTRATYVSCGGVDPWYCGHGAYADTDFHLQAHRKGCRFIDLGIPQLHFPHAKRSRLGKELSPEKLKLLALDNFIYYCRKWELPMSLAEDLAGKSGVKKPKIYVNNKLKAIAKGLTQTVCFSQIAS